MGFWSNQQSINWTNGTVNNRSLGLMETSTPTELAIVWCFYLLSEKFHRLFHEKVVINISNIKQQWEMEWNANGVLFTLYAQWLPRSWSALKSCTFEQKLWVDSLDSWWLYFDSVHLNSLPSQLLTSTWFRFNVHSLRFDGIRRRKLWIGVALNTSINQDNSVSLILNSRNWLIWIWSYLMGCIPVCTSARYWEFTVVTFCGV